MQTPKTRAGILFEASGTLYQYTHYSHLSYLFNVEHPYRRLIVELEYDPLFCEAGTPEMEAMMRQALREQIYRTDEEFVSGVLKKAFPIKNQISVAIRDPKMWRGEHHCFAGSDRIELSAESSCGFFSCENPVGAYEIVLHVFAIYTPECHYWLKVRGEE